MAYRFKVMHRSQDEILVPVSAIDDNLVFVASGKDKELQFTDNVIMAVVRVQEVHVLSPEFNIEVQRIYGKKGPVDILLYLNRWYKNLGGRIDSMRFLHIWLRSLPETTK